MLAYFGMQKYRIFFKNQKKSRNKSSGFSISTSEII